MIPTNSWKWACRSRTKPKAAKSTSLRSKVRPDGEIVVTAENVGDGNALGEKEPIVLSDVVPAGLKAVGISEVDGPDRK